MVIPDRETPGASERACAHPIRMPSHQPVSPSSRALRLRHSAPQRIMPNTISKVATIIGASLRCPSMASSPRTPAAAAGMVATARIHASRLSSLPAIPCLRLRTSPASSRRTSDQK